MNQGVIWTAVAALVLPAVFVVAWNFDEMVGGHDPNAVPGGTLLYFYADW